MAKNSKAAAAKARAESSATTQASGETPPSSGMASVSGASSPSATADTTVRQQETKRAICLAGGGPAAGLHIGVLEGLNANGINFDSARSIWALSCIGAWVGVIYNQAKNDKLEKAKEFFQGVFREDKSFDDFPVNTIFSTDWFGNAEAMHDFLLEPRNYRNAFLPREIMKSLFYTMSALRRMGAGRWRKRGDAWYQEFEEFSEGDFNRWTLNHVLAVNPLVRFLTAMMYKSEITGLTKLHYPDSRFLKDIAFENLNTASSPYILYNAWNLSKKKLQLFTNRKPPRSNYDYKAISPASLCACSALPYIEQTVRIGEDVYCEGALRDTVNFKQLVEDHQSSNDPLEEIWINRIVDAQQIRRPANVHDALANLCEMFAATVGEDDVRLFKYHVKEATANAKLADNEARQAEIASRAAPEDAEKKEKAQKLREAADSAKSSAFTGIIVEIKVDSKINFKWNHRNLNEGIQRGRTMADAAWKLYDKFKGRKQPDEILMIPDDIPVSDIESALTGHPEEHIHAVLAGHPHVRGRSRETQIISALGPH
jgi:predicted acylesterase/phospholipase RssA